MAKKQTFGEEAAQRKGTHRRMAKVIISTKTTRNKYAFKEAMVDQDSVQEFIKEKQS
ncbi:MAG TPA: DUF4295 family protein [Halalkalibaculum sp.]|nr:DUF4295 family protein [Halalkalibaculum sp.]